MSSPLIEIVEVDNLTFPEAIQEIMDGEKVTRVEWDNKEEYGYLDKELLMIHTKDKDHQWIVSEGDLRANDWKVL